MMASSEDYLRGMVEQTGGDWAAAVRDFRQWFGSHAATELARSEGVSRRTAERWIAKAEGRTTQASTPKPMKQVGIVAWAKRQRAARKLRAAQVVHAGRVSVKYRQTGRGEGTRNIGDLPVDGVLAEALDLAADRLEQGDYAGAAEAFDDGVLDAYGVPEQTLDIDDYGDGLSID